MNRVRSFLRKAFPKVCLEWKEPRTFQDFATRLASEKEKPWIKPFLVGLVSVMLLSLWVGRWLQSTDEEMKMSLPCVLTISLLCGFTVVYLLPWICLKLPVNVRLYNDWLVKQQGNIITRWELKSTDSYSIQIREQFSVLLLENIKARRLLVGLPKDVPIVKIEALLKARGLLEKRESSMNI
jgi:hypothetical protein